MIVELACCTRVLLNEIASKEMYQRDVAKTYALALRSSYPTDWAKVNAAIIARWSISGLDRIKNMAWSECFRIKKW
jgi:hypothetical protein